MLVAIGSLLHSIAAHAPRSCNPHEEQVSALNPTFGCWRSDMRVQLFTCAALLRLSPLLLLSLLLLRYRRRLV